MNIRNYNINNQKPAFTGHSKKLDNKGYETHNFYYLYDKNKYKCEVELYELEKDDYGNFSVKKDANGNPTPDKVCKMKNGHFEAKIKSNIGFAYRFKLTDTTTKGESYAFDNGTVINILKGASADNKFNVVLNNHATINKNGPMQSIMPDEYNPGYKLTETETNTPTPSEALKEQVLYKNKQLVKNADSSKSVVRNHANKLGGNFAGIIERLPKIKDEGIKRIVGTPFTKDTISSHLYWTENAYRVAPTLGTDEDFKVFQEQLCKNGINWVADAALVNEGFGGIHMSDVLRKGNESTAKNMIRTEGKVSLGILPDNCEFTRMKLINAPFTIGDDGKYKGTNTEYKNEKPTYVQFYDDRLAGDTQKTSQDVNDVKTYENKNTNNIYDITKHDDAVYPFPIEVDPAELKRNIIKIATEKGKVDFADIDTIKAATNFSNFNVTNKSAAAGLEVWDGNVDIAKLNFYGADNDDSRFANLPEYEREEAIEKFNRGALAVRDYAVNSGKYWTRLVANTQLEYVSKLFEGKNYDDPKTGTKTCFEDIKNLVDKGQLPASTSKVVNEEVVENVLSGKYHSRKSDDSKDLSTSDYILKEAMDVPLETIPVATNLLGVLTSPYIAKKANVPEELGLSRFDLNKRNNPNLPAEYKKVYSEMEGIYEKIRDILKDALPISENNGIALYEKYVISEIVPDLTKYLFVKALDPKAEITISENGEFDFSKVKEDDITIQSLGIPYSGKTAEEEAQIVVNKLKDGLAKISKEEIDDIKSKVKTRFENRDKNSYRLAEMILDRTESGLGWRIDATKDIAAIDSVRANVDSMTDTWNNVIDFWKLYNQTVLKENPHAYTTAEITDLEQLFGYNGDVFKTPADAESKFLQETGITSVANYNYFFSLLPDLFAQVGLDDSTCGQAKQEENHNLLTKMNYGWDIGSGNNQKHVNPGFLFQSPEDGVINSYTFIGNHDKPRILHLLSLDKDLFNSDFNANKKSSTDKTHRQVAAEVLQKPEDKINFDKVSPMAIAMGERLNNAFENIENQLKMMSEEDSAKYTLNKEMLNELNNKNDDELAKYVYINNGEEPIKLDSNMLEYFKEIADGKVKDDNLVNYKLLSEDNLANYKLLSEDELKYLKEAVSNLASGIHRGKKFDAAAFGTRPFEIAIDTVLDEVKYIGKNISNKDEIKAAALKDILEPAMDRFYSIYKLLITLPGSPTDFAGDRVGLSGFETKAKNYHQQNRNTIHWEWLDKPEYSFVKTFYDNMNNIANLRSKEKLSALNDGATVTFKVSNQNSCKIQGLLRYNDSGSVVLTLHNSSGASSHFPGKMDRNEINYGDKLYFDADSSLTQGVKHGLTEGDVFYNARFIDSTDEQDKETYTVQYDTNQNKYYLEKKEKGDSQTKDIVITPEDLNTLVLYKAKDGKVKNAGQSIYVENTPTDENSEVLVKNDGSNSGIDPSVNTNASDDGNSGATNKEIGTIQIGKVEKTPDTSEITKEEYIKKLEAEKTKEAEVDKNKFPNTVKKLFSLFHKGGN